MNDSIISAPKSLGFLVTDFKTIASDLSADMSELGIERGKLMAASGGTWVDGFVAADAQWAKVLEMSSSSTNVMATNTDNFQTGIMDADARARNAFQAG